MLEFHGSDEPIEEVIEEAQVVHTRKKEEAVRSANPAAAKKKEGEKAAEAFVITVDEKSDGKKSD